MSEYQCRGSLKLSLPKSEVRFPCCRAGKWAPIYQHAIFSTLPPMSENLMGKRGIEHREPNCLVHLASKSEPNFRLVLPKSQIRQLDFRFWISDFGFWVSDFGFRVSDLWFWTFDFGCWVLDFGFWIGLVSNLDLAAPNGPVWILDLGFATLNQVDSGPRHLWLSTLFFNVNSMGL